MSFSNTKLSIIKSIELETSKKLRKDKIRSRPDYVVNYEEYKKSRLERTIRVNNADDATIASWAMEERIVTEEIKARLLNSRYNVAYATRAGFRWKELEDLVIRVIRTAAINREVCFKFEGKWSNRDFELKDFYEDYITLMFKKGDSWPELEQLCEELLVSETLISVDPNRSNNFEMYVEVLKVYKSYVKATQPDISKFKEFAVRLLTKCNEKIKAIFEGHIERVVNGENISCSLVYDLNMSCLFHPCHLLDENNLLILPTEIESIFIDMLKNSFKYYNFMLQRLKFDVSFYSVRNGFYVFKEYIHDKKFLDWPEFHQTMMANLEDVVMPYCFFMSATYCKLPKEAVTSFVNKVIDIVERAKANNEYDRDTASNMHIVVRRFISSFISENKLDRDEEIERMIVEIENEPLLEVYLESLKELKSRGYVLSKQGE